MEELTVHCMVRNEPFVYYAVKSVYDYVGKILLYDTGSYDAHTLKDIELLLSEDKDNKIIFEQVPIEVDETKWVSGKGKINNYQAIAAAGKDKKGKWYVREKMIQDTESKFFIILDGDEVYYKSAMEVLQNTAKNWPEGKICGFVSLIWFFDMKHTFLAYNQSGRIFLTKEIGITHVSPGEVHTHKKSGQKIRKNSDYSFCIPDIKPYAHFEKFLKPWRREVEPSQLQKFTSRFPQVMYDNPSFVGRLFNEHSS